MRESNINGKLLTINLTNAGKHNEWGWTIYFIPIYVEYTKTQTKTPTKWMEMNGVNSSYEPNNYENVKSKCVAN